MWKRLISLKVITNGDTGRSSQSRALAEFVYLQRSGMRDDILEAELKQAVAECESLRAENARLRVRLGESPKPAAVHLPTNNATEGKLSDTVTAESPPEQKVELFRSLFRGRDDVYAVRWHGKSGKTGYSPA